MATKRREFWIGEVKQHRKKFRFYVADEGGGGFKSYATEEEAQKARLSYLRESKLLENERLLETALNDYELYKREVLGNKPRTIETTMDRLMSYFSNADLTLPVNRMTAAQCKARYDTLKAKVAVDTHRGTLSSVKTFFNWCVGKKWIRDNPAAGVAGEGKRKLGKEQLRIDEARKWVQVALVLCERGGEIGSREGGRPTRYGAAGPAAALTAFMLGLRADEIASRQVRDLDDDGRLMWVTDAKTKAGKRTQEVPEILQPHLRALVNGKSPTDKLFGGKRWWVNSWVKRICDLSQVPIVCAHSMRGLHSTLAIKRGATAHLVEASLGHESITTTLKHYAAPGSAESAKAKEVERVIKGDRK